jgi:hypothetical protein
MGRPKKRVCVVLQTFHANGSEWEVDEARLKVTRALLHEIAVRQRAFRAARREMPDIVFLAGRSDAVAFALDGGGVSAAVHGEDEHGAEACYAATQRGEMVTCAWSDTAEFEEMLTDTDLMYVNDKEVWWTGEIEHNDDWFDTARVTLADLRAAFREADAVEGRAMSDRRHLPVVAVSTGGA